MTENTVIVAPVVGGGASNAYPAGGSNVFRPGVTFTDPATGKKTDVTGKIYTALYNLTDQQVYEIINVDFKTRQDQNQLKSVLVQGGYLSKDKFQTAYFGSDDVKAMKDLLGKANADGGRTYQEVLVAAASQGSADPKTQTTRSLNLSDESTAKAIVQNAGRAFLGRDMNDKEVKMLTAALSAAEKASPSVSTTTQTSPGMFNTTTTGGLDMAGKGQVVEEAIKEDVNLLPEMVDKKLNSYGDIISRLAQG